MSKLMVLSKQLELHIYFRTCVHGLRHHYQGLNWRALGMVVLLGLLSGCGGEKVYHLSGSVTFKGQPIPDGYIVFEPDGSKGNTGQSGRSTIREGKYNTRGSNGMAVVGGPHVIRIVAHSAPLNPNEAVGGEVVMPSLLFPPYTFSQDLPSESGVVDFDVPAEAAK